MDYVERAVGEIQVSRLGKTDLEAGNTLGSGARDGYDLWPHVGRRDVQVQPRCPGSAQEFARDIRTTGADVEQAHNIGRNGQ